MLKREDLPENFGRDPPYVEKKILAGLRRTSKRKFWQGSAVRRKEIWQRLRHMSNRGPNRKIFGQEIDTLKVPTKNH